VAVTGEPDRVAVDRVGGMAMGKKVVGVVAGLVVWVAIVTVSGIILRMSWPAYASVATAMTFDLPMLVARLSIGALATLATGWVTTVIGPRSIRVRLMPGLILLVAFTPQHIILWNTFPVWYHLTFLLSLVPLTYLGGQIAERSGAIVPHASVADKAVARPN
jgi:hypothetical protein